MGLVNLRTNLKELRFGNDTPQNGDSGLPYIKTSLPENSNAIERIALESARFSADYPIRGGLYSVRANAEDSIRIRKFLTDFPKGSNFTQKQVDLQKSNPEIQTGRNGGRLNTRTYNLNSNLLFSILNAGTGLYYPRAGSTPFTLIEDQNKYFALVGKEDKENNRLINLYNKKLLNSEDGDFLFGISPLENELFSYNGGPDSVYGIGVTSIQRSTDHQGAIINTNELDKPIFITTPEPYTLSIFGASNYFDLIIENEEERNSLKGLYEVSGSVINEISDEFREKNTFKQSFNTIPYDKIIKKELHIIGMSPTDFRNDVQSPEFIFSRDYNNSQIPMITRVGIGDVGTREYFNRKDINNVKEEVQDKVNLIPVLHKNYDEAPETTEGARDLIKFNFETLDNNNLSKTYRTHFRAFLKNFTDGINGHWEGRRYSGRGDNMFNYQGFDRDISFSFMIAPQTKQEMKPLYQKINYLASTIYPDYSPNDGFMRGNIHRLTIGEYLYRTPGILRSININIDNDYPWEIKMDQPEKGFDQDMMELPQVLEVSIRFTPILSELARTININDTNVPSLITNNVGINNFINNFEIE